MRFGRRSLVKTFSALVMLSIPAMASAQAGVPYVAGHIGTSAGDGGAALAAGAAVGYITPRRLGFELDVSATPDLDFGDLGVTPTSTTTPLLLPLLPSIEARGRVLTFQTNALALLASGGKMRAFVSGGGGIANLKQDILYRLPVFPIPVD